MSVRRGLTRLGEMTGKTERDFANAMGNPQSIATMPGGKRLLQWHSGSFNIQRIAVLFDSQHRFERIASRYQV